MFTRQVVLVLGILVLAFGSSQAATVSYGTGSWLLPVVSDMNRVGSEDNVLWWGNHSKNPPTSSLAFSQAGFSEDTANLVPGYMFTIAQLTYAPGANGNPVSFVAELNLMSATATPSPLRLNVNILNSGHDDTITVANTPYTFSVDGSDYSFTLFLASLTALDVAIPSFNVAGDYLLRGVIAPAAVPLPATAWLLGSGLIGLLGFRRRAGA